MNNESNRAPKKHSWLRSVLPAVITLALAGVAILYGPIIADAVKSGQFKPSARLSAVEGRIKLTDRGRQIFFATEPQIEDKQQFNTSCQSTERTVAILGCYYKDKTHLYDIQNAELDGTLEVTAAHEMLHAAYHRLNMFERKRVDDMVKSQYEIVKNDAAIKQVMQYYEQAEPGAEIDELHSILGTTVSRLSPDLEEYYGRYFTDRLRIIGLNAKYNAIFGQLNKQAEELQKQIDQKGPEIKSTLSEYNANLEQLNLDIQSFNERAANGEFASQAAFAAARATLERRVDELNGRRDRINTQVNNYNAMIENLNQLAVHVNQLNKSMNGVDAPAGV